MADLQKFIDSLDHKNLGKDDMAVAIAAICAQTMLDERERCAKICDQVAINAERREASHDAVEAKRAAADKKEAALVCARAIRGLG